MRMRPTLDEHAMPVAPHIVDQVNEFPGGERSSLQAIAKQSIGVGCRGIPFRWKKSPNTQSFGRCEQGAKIGSIPKMTRSKGQYTLCILQGPTHSYVDILIDF